jgi:hypothetical protein
MSGFAGDGGGPFEENYDEYPPDQEKYPNKHSAESDEPMYTHEDAYGDHA